jgi:acetyltransferase-like isoleucine patch superfamily enzyme
MNAKDWEDKWKLELEGIENFLSLHLKLRKEIKKRWTRSLPFNEELFDRWERAKFLGFGKGSSIYDSSIVLGDVQVGENTWVGPFTVLDGSGGLKIGKFCSISAGVQIYTHDSVNWAVTGGKAKYEKAPTIVEDFCYIGSLTVITKGVQIGKHSVVGGHSFVNENVSPFSIAIGVPAKVVGTVEIHNEHVKLKYFNK